MTFTIEESLTIEQPVQEVFACLGVMSSLVGCAADGWSADGGVVAVMVLGVDPVGKRGDAFFF